MKKRVNLWNYYREIFKDERRYKKIDGRWLLSGRPERKGNHEKLQF